MQKILSYPKEKIKILLLENIHPNAVETFKENGYTNIDCSTSALNNEELLNRIKDIHILGIRSATRINKEVLSQCSKLLTIGCFCIGTNQVDLMEATQNGIPVFNDPHSNTRSVAEMVIGLCIGLFRDLFYKNIAAHEGIWKKTANGAHELRGKVIGIVGYGRIGSQVSILAEAMGMQVIYYDVEQKLCIGNVRSVPTLEELLSNSDIVTLHLPETPATENLINRERLKLMKKSAFLINTSRGRVVNIEALAEILQNKEISGAAIDVFSNEPSNNSIPFVNPLQHLENVILTPHIGGATEEAQKNIATAVSQKLIYFLDRGTTEGAVNFPALALPSNENTHRILHIHRNIPGIVSQINKFLADREINILAQYLKTMPELGYIVLDISNKNSNGIIKELRKIEGTIRARVLY